jgi:phosphoglycerate dehydrogenase-like enzyme
LHSKKIAGAALDTYEYEPLQPTHSLVKLARDPESNLLLTPHVASASLPADRSEDFAEIVRFLRGEPLKHEVV